MLNWQTFYYNLITDPFQRGEAIHKEIQNYINGKPCQLSEQIKQRVDIKIAQTVKKVKNGKMVVQKWIKARPKNKKIDWAFKGDQTYVIIDWKTGSIKKNQHYINTVVKYSTVFECDYCRGQIWLYNVETQEFTIHQAQVYKRWFPMGDDIIPEPAVTSQQSTQLRRMGSYKMKEGQFKGKRLRKLPEWYVQGLSDGCINSFTGQNGQQDKQNFLRWYKLKRQQKQQQQQQQSQQF